MHGLLDHLALTVQKLQPLRWNQLIAWSSWIWPKHFFYRRNIRQSNLKFELFSPGVIWFSAFWWVLGLMAAYFKTVPPIQLNSRPLQCNSVRLQDDLIMSLYWPVHLAKRTSLSPSWWLRNLALNLAKSHSIFWKLLVMHNWLWSSRHPVGSYRSSESFVSRTDLPSSTVTSIKGMAAEAGFGRQRHLWICDSYYAKTKS